MIDVRDRELEFKICTKEGLMCRPTRFVLERLPRHVMMVGVGGFSDVSCLHTYVVGIVFPCLLVCMLESRRKNSHQSIDTSDDSLRKTCYLIYC